jgi:hypothetical protein
MKRLQNVAPKLLWHRTGLGIDQAVGGRRGDQGQSSKSSARHRQTFEFLVDEILTGDTVQVQWPQEPPESVYRALLNGVVVQDKNVTSPYYFFQRPSNESADRRMRSTVLESVSGSTPTKRDGVTEGFSHIQEEVVRRGAGSLCEDSAARELLAEMPWALLDHFFQFIEHPDFHAVTSILAGGGGTLPEALSLFAGRPQDCFLLLARPAIRDLIENEKPAGSEIISIGDVLARSYVRSVQAAGVTTVPAHGTASTTCAAIAKHLNRCGDVELELWFESMHQGPTPEDWFVRRAIHGWGSVSEQMCREWTSRLVRLESLPWEKFDGLFISGDEIKPRIAAQRLQQEISRSAKDRINGQDLDRLESDLQQLCSVLREHLEQLMLIYRDLQGFSAQIQRLLLILEPSAIKDSRRRAFEDFTNQFTDLEVLADRSPLRHDGRTIPAIWFTSDHRWYGHLLARRPHREERLRELAGWFLCIFENRKLPKSSAEARPLPSEHFRPRLKPAWESFRVDMPQEELTFVLRWCNLESTGAEQLDSNIKEFQGYRTDLQSTPEALLLDDIIGHLADRRDAAIFVLHIPRICKAVSDRLEEFRLKACSRQLIEDAADMITGLESVRVGSFSRWKELPGMLTTLSELETTSSSSLNAWSNLLGTAPGIVRQAFASGPLEGVFFEAASSIDPIVEWVRAYSAEGIAVLRSELKQLSPATALDDGSRLEPRTADLARQFEKTRSAYENSIEPPKLYRDEWHRLVEWFQLAFEVESLRQSIRKPVVGGDG